MFNSLRGMITEKRLDSLCIATGGIEWEVSVPLLDMEQLPPVGEEGRVLVWLYHREDQMRLFGFVTEERRNTFLELIKVEGIGPRQAVKILSGISQDDLETALENEDIARLEAVPGLGKKTAQKMILALKGKLAHPVSAAVAGSAYEELVNALADMGYDRKTAAEAVERAARLVNAEAVDRAALHGASAASAARAVSTEALAGLSAASGTATLSQAEREKRIFKQAIVILSSQ
ncbi:Holliday junction branch migration protein RuvA [Gracilinema caldarium]|uniref:Holliday junction branch migration complex subunit RuvA n=1 Tax=Gracilinema caldarium (strain ATCC 51460 / DSM 7334 / H1) TaxID=744872 RepID=F8F2U3_GRAC1|nr:Holliday junction branch migration protein RuvA [Gracilinema caldarium]AEJ19487.1 Holliday junction ATP-dependent DNA helicase ruvA [Gracilinema caldarium DSM 7334]